MELALGLWFELTTSVQSRPPALKIPLEAVLLAMLLKVVPRCDLEKERSQHPPLSHSIVCQEASFTISAILALPRPGLPLTG